MLEIHFHLNLICVLIFIDYTWENPDSIYRDEHTCPQCDFALYRNYDKYFSIEKFDEAMTYIDTY